MSRPERLQHIYIDQLFTGREWRRGVQVDISADGYIAAIAEADRPGPDGERFRCAVPGIPNLHSHAHQRAMAGFAERSGAGKDSFWTWREAMYRHIRTMGPDQLQAVAAQSYVEMLEAGYSAVGEFQYLHHAPDGTPFANRAEMSLRCLAAARETGIGITSLPVLYTAGGFGQPPSAGQGRFVNSVEEFLEIVESLRSASGDVGADHVGAGQDEAVGIAPHSLRAVPAAALHEVLGAWGEAGPIHIHVAEQELEIEACLEFTGQRPAEWLLDSAPVNGKWCLIHATHLSGLEISRLAASRAVVGLCPTTEANLGDGIFEGRKFLDAGGAIGIGTDSHISIDPVEDLRWLEYGQRLRDRARTVLAGGPEQSTARRLLEGVLSGGAKASGRPIGEIAVGKRADLVVLDPEHPRLFGRDGDDILDAWIFSGGHGLIRHVLVGGRAWVKDSRHVKRDEIARRFRSTLSSLREDAP